MKIDPYLSLACVEHQVSVGSAKGILTAIATLTADHIPGAPESMILDALIARERLGSTALSHGVALPHAVCPGLDQPLASLIHLEKPIDFSAPDHKLVDIFFSLLLPDHSKSHLPLLADLASRLRKPDYRAALRQATSTIELYKAALSR